MEIRIESSSTAAGCKILVKDNGWGIPAGEQRKVFDEFYRPREEGKKAGGTGLGLAICRRIMQLHGGRIEIADSSLEGTTFRLELPARERTEGAR